MHCLKPACASACIVGALRRQETGAVTYDAWKCMGCRYCMVACPFQVPAYEYDNALTPTVRKCTFCFERVKNEGGVPACAEICPPMCLTFAKRSELLVLARNKIQENPSRYAPQIYGEHEVGGTSWLYLTPRPAGELGFLKLGGTPVPQLTESIQHSVFKFGLPPLFLFGVLGAAMKTFARSDSEEP
jgi:Fe-S-cluster-containing dehydrogenase component